MNPKFSECDVDNFERCNKIDGGKYGCTCFSGYEKNLNDNSSVCAEIKEHPSQMAVEEVWDVNYCDRNSTLFGTFVENINTVYNAAGTSGNFSDIYQRFEVESIAPVSDPSACSPATRRRTSSRKTQTHSAKKALLVSRTQTPKKDETLLVKGKVILRETPSYTQDVGQKFQDALVTVVGNDIIMDQVNITINSSVIKVEGARMLLCGTDKSCNANSSECINLFLPEKNETKGVCRCLEGLVDMSPSKQEPGEICVQGCNSDFCVHGMCLMDERTFQLSCSCSDWYFTGTKCTWDMRIVIGMCVGALVIGILLAALLLYRKRTNRRAPKPEGRESAIPPPARGQVNEGYWTLRRDDAFVREDEGYAWAAAANVSAFERERPWQERLLEIVGEENPQMPSDAPVLLPRLSIRRPDSINERARAMRALDLQGWESEEPRPGFISLRPGIRYGSSQDLYREASHF